MSSRKPTHRDLHAEITNQLIAAIESRPGTFDLPWRRAAGASALPVNAASRKAYSGVNAVSLWAAQSLKGFPSPVWATYRQWSEQGCHVRKGERSALVVFYKEYLSKASSDATDEIETRLVARASSVFNASQVEGYPAPEMPAALGPIARIVSADRFVKATSAHVQHGGDRAFYQPASDHIQMPDEGLFTGTPTLTRSEGYYATLLHELVHWTAAPHRLDRKLGRRFGDRFYAAEELVAEIGAAFLCAELEVTAELRPDHAQYLAQWLELLKSDSRAIFTLAAKASEAAKFLHAAP